MISRSSILLILLILLVAQALLTACERHPCPEGTLSSTLRIEDGDITVQSLQGDWQAGTLDEPNPGLLTCTSIHRLKFSGAIPHLDIFAAVEQLGELFFVDGVSEEELTGLPNMRTLGALTMRGRVVNLDVFSALEVAGTLSFDGGLASFVAPNLTRAANLTGGGYLSSRPRSWKSWTLGST